ncbi:MAG: CHAD domain-containing protein [Planctomycetota bacterium]|nr:CHAD domain-containing protein [Planctomycetota bacterium]
MNGIKRDTLVRDAVRLTLQHQLNAVLHFLAFAAEKSCDDVEYVHHLRVSVRRMGTALRVYRRALPKKELSSIRKKLETIRRAAGKARDLDVFLEHVIGTGTGSSNSLAAQIKHQREKAQRPIVRCFVKAGRKKGLKNRLFKLLARIQKNNESASRLIGVWAKKQLRDAIKRFHHARPSDINDLRSVHCFRIRTKELRYTIELLDAAFPVERTCSVFPLVETLQQRLGDINDRAVTISILNELSVTASKRRDRIKLKQKQTRETNRLEKALASFQKWWTHKRQDKLFNSLRRLTKITHSSGMDY